ncbi:LLM class flavin-dependent oxidoreductase [Kitasatospora sp. GP82]|uniref:LLM class flavin-dependent oxidoreductase n=1 Tax=Kitasatospora sp. GP82 TaxID=3035089 RepID=UPI0024764E8B|nr:LLM class flavin-dependent oxidoreductase [Kitasatospora sp. GP82]MDH6128162.1 putative F420-dependent oxidoreductase [Kitasatospora sp. GP82]
MPHRAATTTDGPRFGVVLPGRETVIAQNHYARHLAGLSALAEESGYDSIWAGESPLARSRMDPLLALAAASAVTARVELGTAVLLPLRSPVQLAHELACLDRLSGGRLVAGVGAGFRSAATEAEFTAYGVPFKERVGRLAETAEICRLLWTSQGKPVSYRGKYHRIDDVVLLPVPERPGGPALWLAGATDFALRRAGTGYAGWMPTSTTAAEFAEGWTKVQEAAAEAGRTAEEVTPAVYLTIAVDEDAERAERTLQDFVGSYYRLDLPTMRTTQGIYGGTARQVAEWVQGYLDAGARHVVFRLATSDLGEESYRAAMHRIAGELLPSLRRPLSQPVGVG